MSQNIDALVFESQIVINDTTAAGITSGSIINKGGFSTLDTYIIGNTSINNVNITPNLNDIIFEQQATLSNNQMQFVNINNFYFDSSVTNSFKTFIAVNVSTGISKYSMWEINGLYKPSGWVITSTFAGDITGVEFSIQETEGIANMQYKNSNTEGTTIIRYRATTTAPPGSTPIGDTVGISTNTSGPFITDKFIYASTPNTFASSELGYVSNVFTIGGGSRILAQNANSFTNYSNGGAITSMGDASVAQNLIVGQKIGINNTSPSFNLDVQGTSAFSAKAMFNGNQATISTTTGSVVVNGGIGVSDSIYIGGDLIIQGDSLKLPVGDNSTRPVNATDGFIRFNSDNNEFEGFGPFNTWGSIGGSGGGGAVGGKIVLDTGIDSPPTLSQYGGNGTRIIMKDGIQDTSTPYAIGLENNNMWFSTEFGGYKWYNNTTPIMQITGSNLVITGEITAFGNISDRRFKHNIQNITTQDALNTISQLRPVTFDWNLDIPNIPKRGTSDSGFIAQEVQEIIPHAVSDFKEIQSDTTFKNMKHERIIPYLVGAIQELHQIIQNLQNK